MKAAGQPDADAQGNGKAVVLAQGGNAKVSGQKRKVYRPIVRTTPVVQESSQLPLMLTDGKSSGASVPVVATDGDPSPVTDSNKKQRKDSPSSSV